MGTLAGYEALVLLCRQELVHSLEQGLGVGSTLSAQEQCSQYQDRQMHTSPNLLWPWSQVTQLRDLFLQKAFPVPFAFLLDAQVIDKVTLDPTLPHPHSPSGCGSRT